MSSASILFISVFYIVSVNFYGSVQGASYYEASAITGNNRRVRSSCQARGGDLATFDSSADVGKIYDLCQDTGYPGGGCYVGFNDVQQLNVWRWIDGTPFDGWSWVHSSGFERSSYDRCGAVAIAWGRTRPLEDFACDNVAGYGICEYPIAMCSCFSVDLIRAYQPRFNTNQCYQYRFQGCDDIDTVRFGIANFDTQCGFNLRTAFRSLSPSTLSYRLVTSGVRGTKGIEISGLEDGDIFTMCFDRRQVRGTMEAGNIAFEDDEESDTCQVMATLPGFCPGSRAENDFVVEMDGEDVVKTVNTVNTVNEAPMELMPFVWAAIISCIVSIIVVLSAYTLCIKPANKTEPGYDKVMLDEEEEEVNEAEKDAMNI